MPSELGFEQATLRECHATRLGMAMDYVEAAAFVARTTKAMVKNGTRRPASWKDFFAERHPYNHADVLDHLLDGLLKAGISV